MLFGKTRSNQLSLNGRVLALIFVTYDAVTAKTVSRPSDSLSGQ
jgi:hypothetical protein